jgi:hypothetical protein
VPTAFGGCAPAVVVCAPGARPTARGAACAAAWPVPPRALNDEGAIAQNLHTLPGGEIGGAWRRDGETCAAGGSRDADGACTGVPSDGTRTPLGLEPAGDTPCAEPDDNRDARYVDARAAAGGDGSRERPFATLAEAIGASAPDGTLVLLPGRHVVAPFAVTRALTLRGSCARAVTVRFSGDGVAARGPDAHLTFDGVTLEADQRAIAAEARATVTVTRSVVRVHRGVALAANDAALDLRRSLIDARGAETEGRALMVRGGALEARECVVLAAGGVALSAMEGARVTLDDVALRGDDAVEVVSLAGGSTLAARTMTLEGGSVSALNVTQGATANLESVVLRGLRGSDLQVYRSGALLVQRAGRLRATDVLIERVGVTGLAVRDAQTVVNVDGLVVRDVAPSVGTGRCVDVNDGARATLRRVALRRCHDAGLQVAEFARVDLRDASVREVAARSDGLFGFGLTALSLGHLDARRVLIDGATMGGIGAIGLPEALLERAGLAASLRPLGELSTRVRAEDVVIRGGAPSPSAGSFALVTAAGVSLEGSRIGIIDAAGVSIAVTPNGYPTAPFIAALVNSARVSAGVGELLRRVLPPDLDGASSMRLTDVYVQQGHPWRVGFDPNATTQPDLRASIGVYVGRGCSLSATHLSIDGGEGGEYALANHGVARVEGLRASAVRRCEVSEGTGAAGTLIEGAPPIAPACRSVGLELVRLPVSTD